MKPLLLAILIFFSVPQSLLAEYNRATKEDEFILVSTEREVRMGESISKNVVKRFGLAEDELVQNRVRAIGKKLVEFCDRKDITYHFTVLSGEDLKPEQKINAFALPGGYVYIFEAFVEKLETDDQVASVIAHEIGHIAAKHSVKRLQGSLGTMALKILATRMETDNETRARAHTAINLLMLAYSREDEFLADKLGVKYTRLAGFDPEGSVKVIEKLMEIQRNAPIRPYSGYRTHPYLAERKAIVRKEIHGHMDFVDFINMPEQAE